ncbi:MAG: SDR family NAD(P)-dependent oxidoreductase [Eubacteriales bacterium]|nr:SDR family NAD(P)-dependent oxidoreductase [Eubacteriales bacterium]
MKLLNRAAFITGAGSGIGREIAMAFAQEGAFIIAADLNLEAAQKTADMIKEYDAEAVAVQVDVGNFASFEKAIKEGMKDYGKIDILVNNAGIFDGQKDVVDTDPEDFDRVIDVNLKSVFYGTKLVIKNMIKTKRGVIINISSVAGVRGNLASPAYTASKHGVIGLTKDVASKYGKYGIRSVAICPGMIATNMTKDMLDEPTEETKAIINSIPMQRAGKADEIGRLVSFLASDDASYITGTEIIIDGGMTS